MKLYIVKNFADSGEQKLKFKTPDNDNIKGKGRPPEPRLYTTSQETFVLDERGNIRIVVPHFM